MTVLRLKTIEMIISSTAGEAWVLNQFQNCILDHFFFQKGNLKHTCLSTLIIDIKAK